MDRREELENKFAEFETERKNRLANRGGSKRTKGPGKEEDPEGQGQLTSLWDQSKPKAGTYPSVGPDGPGDLNVEGDWEGPIDFSSLNTLRRGGKIVLQDITGIQFGRRNLPA